jgi:hypothetical protein
LAAAAILVVAALALSQVFFSGGRGPVFPGRSGGVEPALAYSADVAAPAALTFVSGPDPSIVSRVLRPTSSNR